MVNLGGSKCMHAQHGGALLLVLSLLAMSSLSLGHALQRAESQWQGQREILWLHWAGIARESAFATAALSLEQGSYQGHTQNLGHQFVVQAIAYEEDCPAGYESPAGYEGSEEDEGHCMRVVVTVTGHAGLRLEGERRYWPNRGCGAQWQTAL